MSMSTQELEGRVAIVTGAGRGIGRAVALALVGAGARVVVNDIGRSETGMSSAEQVVGEIESTGGRAVPSEDSVTDYAAAGRIIETAQREFGRVDILINNAGVASGHSILEADEAEFARVTPSHIAGTFNCTSHAAKRMAEAGWGRVVNLVSRAGLTGMPGTIAYAMGKGAVLGLTNGASRELIAHGITVNGICPASTRTTMVESAIDAMRAEGGEPARRAENLLAQMQAPEDVAPTIVALCSEAAGQVNGQIFLVEKNRIGLFQPMTVTQSLERADDWSPRQLAEALAGLDLHGLADAYS